MPAIRQMTRATVTGLKKSGNVNWHPGHMYGGLRAMIGKLNTVDCVVEVHDARIPLIGRNDEFKKHLGQIKPRVLVLNKIDLADMTKWPDMQERLQDAGDNCVVLTDLRTNAIKPMKQVMQKCVDLINSSDRYNRQSSRQFKIMIVGIPNVGKSTLINRLRQSHLNSEGVAQVGALAGVTRAVQQTIKVCARPPVYLIDTPGVLQPGVGRHADQIMPLALCSSVNDAVLKPIELAEYLIEYLVKTDNQLYRDFIGSHNDKVSPNRLHEIMIARDEKLKAILPTIDDICWRFVRKFRKGEFGKVMFQ